MTWHPFYTAPKDNHGILVYVPSVAHNLQTRGLYTMHWTGWGCGAWEATAGWRPRPDELRGAVWTPLEPIAAAAKDATENGSAAT